MTSKVRNDRFYLIDFCHEDNGYDQRFFGVARRSEDVPSNDGRVLMEIINVFESSNENWTVGWTFYIKPKVMTEMTPQKYPEYYI